MKMLKSWTSTSVVLTADKKVPPVSAGGFLLGFIWRQGQSRIYRVQDVRTPHYIGWSPTQDGPWDRTCPSGGSRSSVSRASPKLDRTDPCRAGYCHIGNMHKRRAVFLCCITNQPVLIYSRQGNRP